MAIILNGRWRLPRAAATVRSPGDLRKASSSAFPELTAVASTLAVLSPRDGRRTRETTPDHNWPPSASLTPVTTAKSTAPTATGSIHHPENLICLAAWHSRMPPSEQSAESLTS